MAARVGELNNVGTDVIVFNNVNNVHNFNLAAQVFDRQLTALLENFVDYWVRIIVDHGEDCLDD